MAPNTFVTIFPVLLPLSFSFPVRGAGHHPNSLQEVPETSRICIKFSSTPDIPPNKNNPLSLLNYY